MSKAVIEKYQKRDIICSQGDAGRRMYKILSGMVALYANYGQPGEHLVEILNAPNSFGEMSVLAGRPSAYTAVAFSDAAVLHVPEEAFHTFIRNDHQTAIGIMKKLARRAARLDLAVEELKELSRMDAVEGAALQELAGRCTAPDEEEGPAPKKGPNAAEKADGALEAPLEPEERFMRQLADTGLFLPGHMGYPGVTHPEYKTYLFDKNYTCPHCRQTFQGVRPFYAHSKLVAVPNPERMRYSLRIFYRDFAPEWYDVATCPHCYFSTLDSVFLEDRHLKRGRYEQALLDARDSIWMDFEAERDLDFVFAQHYLALLCAWGYFDSYQITAHLWLNLSWLYRSVKEEELVRAAEYKAQEAYQEVYRSCQLEPAQEQQVCLTIADILYRAGDKLEARKWAMKIRMNRAGKAAYSNLAEQMIEDIRAEMAQSREDA